MIFASFAATGTVARAERGDLHGGLNLRTDLGTHAYRVELGGRYSAFEAAVVLDPRSAVDGQTDHDLLVFWWFQPGRWSAFTGWRTSAYAILGEVIWHQKLLAGLAGRLPSLLTDRVRFVGGVEVCAEVVRHGGERIATEWFAYDSGRAVDDLVNFSLFVRAELASPF